MHHSDGDGAGNYYARGESCVSLLQSSATSTIEELLPVEVQKRVTALKDLQVRQLLMFSLILCGAVRGEQQSNELR